MNVLFLARFIYFRSEIFATLKSRTNEKISSEQYLFSSTLN